MTTPSSHAGGNSVPILMYHAIGISTTRQFARFTLHPRLFANQMRYLANAGYRTSTVSQLMARRDGGAPEPDRTVVLTFDDGYEDFYELVLPILDRFGFTATLYVTTGHIGKRAPWTYGDHGGRRWMLSWQQVEELAAAGIEIGAHTVSHPELDWLPPAALRRELAESRDQVADHLGTAVESFAYPFGYHSPEVTDAVAEAGFASACAVGEYASTADGDRLRVPRLSVPSGTDIAGLRRLLARGAGPGRRLRAESKRLAWQAWRRHRPFRPRQDGLELPDDGWPR